MADNHVRPCNRIDRMLTIDDLSDDELLEIFNFYVVDPVFTTPAFGLHSEKKRKTESWKSLVHVCRRWRGLAFASPRRLNLQLFHQAGPRKATLDVWPALPLFICGAVNEESDIAVLLEHSDRISQIDLFCYKTSHIEKLCTVMQVPFPELAVLRLCFDRLECRPVLPDSIFGGSASRLRSLYLDSVSFPGLPKLLLSATHLVELSLEYTPRSGYISPEVMTTCLSVLTSLETLQLEFNSSKSYPDLNSRRPYSPTRSVLPTLTNFSFKGVNEYSEEFVARIDAPQLSRLSTTFFHDIDVNAPELNQFISRTPILGTYDEASLIFGDRDVRVRFRQSHRESSDHGMVEVKILCRDPDWHLSSLAQICTLSLCLLLTSENLYIKEGPFLNSPLRWPHHWERNIKNTRLSDLLRPFTAVKNLYLSKLFSSCIAIALQELTGGRTIEVLPALKTVLLEGFRPSRPDAAHWQNVIERFLSAEQLTNHPVTISVWDREPEFVWG